MKKLKILTMIILVSAFSFSQSINVTFQVDMSFQAFEGNFPPGANVVVRGNFQSDFGDTGGNWQGNLYQLSDPDSDDVYTSTFNAPTSLAGNNYAFKYVIVNPPAGDNWESISDRQFTLTAPSTILPVVYFNNDSFTVCAPPTNTINFTADISSILGIGIGGAFNPSQDSLLVMGLDWDNLGKDIVGERRMVNTDPFNQGIYTTTLTVTSGPAAPNGVGDSTKWKFRAFPDSRFLNGGWETGADRWHIYQANGSIVNLPIIVSRILPKFGGTTIPIDLTINVDMLGAVNRYNGLSIPISSLEFVGMRGSTDFLGNWNNGGCWCVNDTLTGHMKVLTLVSPYIWRFNTIIPVGTSAEVYEYKFAAMYPGADTVNGGINPLDNEGGFGWNHVLSINNTSPIVRNHYFGSSDPYNVERIDNLIPAEYSLEQNYPNPFNPTTKIRYNIPSVGTRQALYVKLKVYDVLGREVVTLVDAEQPAGVYEATFDASELSSGIYFYTLRTEKIKLTKKMILVR